MFEPLSNDMEADDMENIILDKMVYKAFVCDVDDVLTDDRRRGVIHQRFGLDDDNQKSLEEVGKYYNVTRERVRQMEAKAIRILAGSPKIKQYNGGN